MSGYVDTQNDPFLTHTLPGPGSTHSRAQQNLRKNPYAGRSKHRYAGKGAGDLMWDGGALPFMAFAVITGLFSFTYHMAPLVSWVIALLAFGALVNVLPPYPTRAQFVDWVPMGSLTMSIVFGIVIGGLNFDYHMYPFFVYAFHTSYGNVLPSEGAAAHADAGKIIWAASARVDHTRAVGFKGLHTYCVAPVLDDSDMSKIGFWAAGFDCCGARGSFWCDEAGYPMAYGAVPLKESKIVGLDHTGFEKAIKLAEASFNIHAEKDPLLVRWVTNPVAYQWHVLYLGVGTYVMSVMIALICAVMIAAFINFNVD